MVVAAGRRCGDDALAGVEVFQSAGKHMAIAIGSVGIFLCRAAPVLGFVDVGYLRFSLVADHYQYIAIIGIVTLAAASWSIWQRKLQGATRSLATALATLFVGCLMLLTWNQCELYGSPIRLYEATLAKNPTSWMAHYNLGAAFFRSGQPTAAIEQFREAVQFNANYPEAHNNWGNAPLALGEPEAAAAQFEEALRLRSDFPEAYYNLGNAKMRRQAA